MFAIIGACLFSVVIILSLLIICGLPLGELTMGGQYKVFPKKLRFVLAVYLTLNALMDFVSKSKKEKYIMTPLALASAVCFWITALQ